MWSGGFKKNLTVSQIGRILISTNAMCRPDADTPEIIQEHKRYLTFEALLLKNRVWVSVCKGLWDFEGKFLGKKVPRSSRLVLECRNHGPSGWKMG